MENLKENEINPRWKLHILTDLEARISANKNRYLLGLRTLSNVAYENEHVIRAINSIYNGNEIGTKIIELLNQINKDVDMININANNYGFNNFYKAYELIANDVKELKEKLGIESVYLPLITRTLAKKLEIYYNELQYIISKIKTLAKDIKDVLHSVEKEYGNNKELLDYDGISYVEKAKNELKQLHRVEKALSHICWLAIYLDWIANSLEP